MTDVLVDGTNAGANGTPGATGAAGVQGNTLLDANGFRLTLTSGVPVTTTDVTGAGTLYLTPMFSSQLALYTGAGWQTFLSGELALTLAVLAGTNYDVFAYAAGGAPFLELSTAWASDTTRTNALALQDGIFVKSTDHTRRYLGTLRGTGTNTTEDSAKQRFLYNFRNQQPRPLLVTDSKAAWPYPSNAWRQADPVFAGTANQWSYVVGMAFERITAAVMACGSGGSGNQVESVGIGVDSVTVPTGLYGSGDQSKGALPTVASYEGAPGLGFHTIAWLEAGNGTPAQFYGNANSLNRQIAGMLGTVRA